MSRKIKVQLEEETRLDTYLSEVFDLSRSQMQKHLKKTAVEVNGEEASLKTKLKDGDEVVIEQEPVAPSTEPIIPPPFPEILYEDDDVVIINKPSGLTVHPTHEADRSPTLAHAIIEKYPELDQVGDEPKVRPGMVHRLDKGASGVLVIAKTQEAFEFVKSQFKARTVTKFYTVLVYGNVSKDHDFIKFKVDRSKRKGSMGAFPEDSDRGRDAVTEYDVLERFATTTLLKVQIHTGRTHQIRVHFFALDHPVVGDKLYKKKIMKNIRHLDLDRLFLHATELTLTLPSGEEKTIRAELPDELKQVLTTLSK